MVGGGGGWVLMAVVAVRWRRPYLSHNHTAGLCTGWWVVPLVVRCEVQDITMGSYPGWWW